MNVLQEIVHWANNDLQGWQSDAVRRLIGAGDLTSADAKEIFNMLRQRHQLLEDGTTVPRPQRPSPADVSTSGSSSVRVALLSLSGLENVNALQVGQRLEFGESGLTVIYGDNASGKSGYSRVLKRACRARDDSEKVLPNVFTGSESGGAKAIFELSVNGTRRTVTWEDGSHSPDELANFAVFDSRCARLYVDHKGEITYVPYGMDIFRKLIKLQDELRNQLKAEKKGADSRPSYVDDFDEESTVGKEIANLSADSSRDKLREWAAMSTTEIERLKELSELVREFDNATMKRKADESRRLKDRIAALRRDLATITETLSETNLNTLRTFKETVAQAFELVRVASEEAFVDEPIDGVGTDPWKALFNAAKHYSEELAYPNQEFPVFVEGSRCVLCQQTLDEDARARFNNFKQFMLDDAEQKLAKARTNLAAKVRVFETADIVSPQSHSETLKEIGELDRELAGVLSAIVTGLPRRYEAIADALKTDNWDTVPEIPSCDLSTLVRIENAQEAKAKKFESMEETEEQSRVRSECAELSQRKLLSKHLEKILDQIDILKRDVRLDSALRELGTSRITSKSSRLMQMVATEALRKGLREEMAALGIESIQVSLDPSGGKGIAFHQLKLPTFAKSKSNLSDVLSEGEQRIVAIASFLAELNTAPSGCGIIFDDPVSSLDHRYRRKLAARLVGEAKKRQVVIFTHDMLFLQRLYRIAGMEQVSLVAQQIERSKTAIGRCRIGLPWLTKSVKQKISDLHNFLDQQVKPHWEQDEGQYEIYCHAFYGRLRQTWERAVEETLLNGVLDRFSTDIHTEQVKGIEIRDEDYQYIEREMSKCSTWMGGHDGAPADNEEHPSFTDMETDLQSLKSFVKETNNRIVETAKRRRGSLRPPSP